jgi:pimeloyl-ACP methyl ester carboxylesterase
MKQNLSIANVKGRKKMGHLTRENSSKIYYEDSGSGDSAIVLIHGWGVNLRVWDKTVPALTAAGHRVIALDHRACGQSDADFESISIEGIASDVVALVHELGLRKVVLNGWSLGGAVAVNVANTLQDLCVGVLLTCAVTPAFVQKDGYPHGGDMESFEGIVGAVNTAREETLPNLSIGCFAEGAPQKQIDAMTELFRQSDPAATASLAQLGTLDQRDDLQALRQPVLVIVGAQDALVDPNIPRSVQNFHANTVTVEFEKSGHSPFWEETDKYNAELVSFADAKLSA